VGLLGMVVTGLKDRWSREIRIDAGSGKDLMSMRKAEGDWGWVPLIFCLWKTKYRQVPRVEEPVLW
jgi:hypothetical protein